MRWHCDKEQLSKYLVVMNHSSTIYFWMYIFKTETLYNAGVIRFLIVEKFGEKSGKFTFS